jgi:hypothetical protein
VTFRLELREPGGQLIATTNCSLYHYPAPPTIWQPTLNGGYFL